MKLTVLALTMIAVPLAAQVPADSTRDSSKVFKLGEIVVQGTPPGPAAFEAKVSSTTIRELNRTDLAQAATLLPGVSLTGVGARNEATLSVRGFDLRQTPVLIDGVPVYVPYDGYVDLRRFLTPDVAEIQVNRGYSSALLGPNSLGGAINVVTRRPVARYEGTMQASAFSGEGRSASLSVGSRLSPRFYVQGGGAILRQESFPLSDDFVAGRGQGKVDERDNSYRRDVRVNAKVGFTPRDADEYAIGAVVQRGEKENPPYAGNDPAIALRFWKWPTWDKTSVYSATRTAIGGNAWVKTRAFYDKFDNRLESYDDSTYTAQTRGYAFNSIYDDHTWGANAEVGSTIGTAQTIAFAGHLKTDVHKEHNIPEPVRTNSDRTWSLGTEYSAQLSSRFRLFAGMSYDRRVGLEAEELQSGNVVDVPVAASGAFNPQVALIAELAEGSSIRASVARKSRFPTIKDRYSYRMGTAIPNPELTSEHATHLELAVAQRVTRFGTLKANVFYSRINDIIQRVDDVERDSLNRPLFQLQNVGDARAQGFELEANIQPVRWFSINGSYSRLDRKNITAEEIKLVDTPKYHLIGWAELRPSRWGMVALIVDRNGSRYATTAGAVLDAFTTVDARARFTPGYGIGIDAGVYNLFDKNYALSLGYPEPGRSVSLGISYDFSGGGQ